MSSIDTSTFSKHQMLELRVKGLNPAADGDKSNISATDLYKQLTTGEAPEWMKLENTCYSLKQIYMRDKEIANKLMDRLERLATGRGKAELVEQLKSKFALSKKTLDTIRGTEALVENDIHLEVHVQDIAALKKLGLAFQKHPKGTGVLLKNCVVLQPMLGKPKGIPIDYSKLYLNRDTQKLRIMQDGKTFSFIIIDKVSAGGATWKLEIIPGALSREVSEGLYEIDVNPQGNEFKNPDFVIDGKSRFNYSDIFQRRDYSQLLKYANISEQKGADGVYRFYQDSKEISSFEAFLQLQNISNAQTVFPERF